jgi:hypothetical protein
MMGDSFVRREQLQQACVQGEKILKDIMDVEERAIQNGAAPVTLASAVSSPLQPFWVSESELPPSAGKR